jgi:TonB family protein
LYQRADWLNHAGAHIMERAVYKDIIEIIEANQGSKALELILPLTRVAETYRLHPEMDPTDGITDGYVPYRRALQMMERAASIAEANPTSDRLVYADTVISLGDYSNLFEFQGKAKRNYAKAWNLLGVSEEYTFYRERQFGAPTLIQGGQPAPLYELVAGQNPDPFEESADYRGGYVVVHYDVTAGGRTQNIQVFESYPPGLMDREVTRIVNRFKYRPRMIKGQAVPTESLRFRHEFKYYLRHVPDKVLARMKKVATQVEFPNETEND